MSGIELPVGEGTLGRVQRVHTRWLRDRTDGMLTGHGRGEWCRTAATAGGGPLIDLGIHKLDLALYLLDWPEVASVTGFTSHGLGRDVAETQGITCDLEDYAFGMIRFADGAAVTVEASYFRNTPGEVQDLVIDGTIGALALVRREATLTTPCPRDGSAGEGSPLARSTTTRIASESRSERPDKGSRRFRGTRRSMR